MRIGVLMRADGLSKRGGDTVQMEAYLQHAKTLGLFDGDIVCDLGADLSRFDLLHLTNIDRPVELDHFLRLARRLGKPTVLTTIHHAYGEIERYERIGRRSAASALIGRLSFQQLELLRSVVRSLRTPAMALPTLRLAMGGVRRRQREALEAVGCVLTLTEKELTDLVQDFGSRPRRHAVIANGCDFHVPDAVALQHRDIDFLIVGRIEARKNTLAILDALESIGASGVFVGGLNPNHRTYCQRFQQRIAHSRSRYLGAQDRSATAELFARAKVHVSASWFEVASLVDLEAAAMGCKVVASVCGGTHERLGSAAWYCQPDDPSSLREAMLEARSASDTTLADPSAVFEVPRWDDAVRSLHAVYQSLLVK